MTTRRRFLLIAAAAVAASPGEAEAVTTWRGVALGADAAISLRGDRRAAAAALEEARRRLGAIERRFSLYRADSLVSRLNRGERPALPPEAVALLSLCDRLHRATGGRFDPTVQPLWRALAEGRPSTLRSDGSAGAGFAAPKIPPGSARAKR